MCLFIKTRIRLTIPRESSNFPFYRFPTFRVPWQKRVPHPRLSYCVAAIARRLIRIALVVTYKCPFLRLSPLVAALRHRSRHSP